MTNFRELSKVVAILWKNLKPQMKMGIRVK